MAIRDDKEVFAGSLDTVAVKRKPPAEKEESTRVKKKAEVPKEVVHAVATEFFGQDWKKIKLQVWSAKIIIALRALREVIPKYSMSKEAEDYLWECLKNDYPELIKDVEEEMKKVNAWNER